MPWDQIERNWRRQAKRTQSPHVREWHFNGAIEFLRMRNFFSVVLLQPRKAMTRS